MLRVPLALVVAIRAVFVQNVVLELLPVDTIERLILGNLCREVLFSLLSFGSFDKLLELVAVRVQLGLR